MGSRLVGGLMSSMMLGRGGGEGAGSPGGSGGLGGLMLVLGIREGGVRLNGGDGGDSLG